MEHGDQLSNSPTHKGTTTMTIDNGSIPSIDTKHISGHFTLPTDTERNLKVVVETALTELAESVVQGMIDKQFNAIVDKVLTNTIENKFGDLVKYITDNFKISPEGERNIALVMETAIIKIAHTSVERIVDKRFDDLFRTIIADTLNTRVKYAMMTHMDDMQIGITDLVRVENGVTEQAHPPTTFYDALTAHPDVSGK
jgi:hypothetical protein